MLDWTIEVRDRSRIRVGQFVDADLTDFICVPRANEVGSWSIKLPDTVIDEQGDRVPHEMCAALREENAGIIVTGPQGLVLSGSMIHAEQEQHPEDPDGTWTIVGVSDTVILDMLLAFPQPTNSNPSTQNVSNDVRTDDAEGLIRSFVSANIGPAATVARRVADLTLTADENRGPILTKSPRFQQLLELCQDIATGSGILFDVIQVGSGRQLRVLDQLDVSAAVRWDIENRQLASAKYGYGAPDLTRAIVAGQGEGTDRTIVEVTTAASLAAEGVWGRRERFVDQRQTDDIDELAQKGETELTDGAVVRSLEVVPSSDMASGFMPDWFLGSFVTVTLGGEEVVVPVTEVPIAITRDGVFIGATVGDSTGFDWESVLRSEQQRTKAQVSAIERNLEVPGSLYSQAQVDALLLAIAPVGSYKEFAGRSIPVGAPYLKADGSAKSRTTYPNLYNYLCESLGTVTVTIASPAVVTKNGHGLVAGDKFFFETTGSLPTGLAANTIYYVLAAGLTANTFRLAATDGGAAINTSGAQAGVHSLRFCPYGLGGSTTFNVPDFGEYVGVGAKAGSAEFPSVGRVYGEKAHTLSQVETPYNPSGNEAAGYGLSSPSAGFADRVAVTRGGTTAHNNIQPSRAVLVAIRY